MNTTFDLYYIYNFQQRITYVANIYGKTFDTNIFLLYRILYATSVFINNIMLNNREYVKMY